MSFKSLAFGAIFAGVAVVAPAQWVAFNDHYSGPGTAPFTTTWNVFGAGTGAAGSAGPLTNIVTGAVLPVTLTITGSGMTGGTSSGAPDVGTPAYNIFNGFVDFGNGTLNHAVQLPPPATVNCAFTGLNPTKRYKFTGTAVRGNSPYTDRWTTYELVSAQSFTSAHTSGCLTNGTVGVPPADISTSQVALNSGWNNAGDLIVWDNIDPGPDGAFNVTAVTYRGTVPGGSSGGSYGYALTGIKLEEFDTTQSPVAITTQPQSQTVGELQPVTFSVATTGNPFPTFQWYKGTQAIFGATNSSYFITNAALSDNSAQFSVIAYNTASNVNYSATSQVAVLTVNADTVAPTIVQALGQPPSSVTVIFSERVRLDTATNLSNYFITNSAGVNLIINSAVLLPNQTTVAFTTSPQAQGATYTIVVNGIRDPSTASNLISANSLASFTSVSFVPGDVGSVLPAGSSVVAGNGFNITAGGTNIDGIADQFSYEFQTLIGDFDVKVRLAGLSLSDVWAKAGLMARESTAVGSAFAATLVTAGSAGTVFESRATTGATAATTGYFPANYPNAWVRLQRVGNVFTGYGGFDGSSWTVLGTLNAALANSLQVGLVVTSHTNNGAATAQFRDYLPGTGGTTNYQAFPIEPAGPSSRKTPFAITEIMYKPVPARDANSNSFEFIEIYNSNPFFEEISNYKLAGAIDYTFPPNTFLQANQYIVVAASPAAVQARYGITGVFGPYTNSLSSSGTIKLLNNSKGVVLTVPYANDPPWPVAADGTGHSLVLVRPSYGEGDAHAWAASDQLGGSPGRIDGFTFSPLRNVVINEFLANSTLPDYDYIELYNHSTVPVDLFGCMLSDDPATNKYVISTHVTIPARGFVVFDETQIGFALSASGESIYFRAPNGTVLDVIKFQDQSEGVASGRYPDGAKEIYRLSAKTPGASNTNILINDIVINEIMVKPLSGSSDDQYVELYNKGTNTVSLSKWRFDSGITFTFPTNATIAPDHYVVVARNITNLLAHYPNLNSNNTYGDFSGKIKVGDRLSLALPEVNISTTNNVVFQTNNLHVVVDEVTINLGGNWPKWADQGGSSMELIDPRSNHRLGQSWADSDETQKAPWTLVESTGTMDNGADGTTSLESYLMGEGECLIDNIEMFVPPAGANVCTNGTFDGGLSTWILRGDHIRSGIDAANGYPSGGPCMHIRASSRGDSIINRLRVPIASGFPSSGAITIRYKARWLKGWPEVLVRTHGNYFDCVGRMTIPSNLGTPGARNSRALTNGAPAIFEVRHDPVLPLSGQPVVVTARRYDPDGIGSMVVRYRIDPSPTYASVAMVDDGTGGDAVAGDGIFSATLPGQGGNTMMAFQVVAADTLGATNVFPFGDPSYVRPFECLVRFGDPMPSTAFANYRQWVTTDNISDWQNRQANSNERIFETFVYGNFRAIYNASVKWAGSPYHQFTGSPVTTSAHYSIAMPGDDLFLGESNINKVHAPGNGPFDDGTIQREQLGYWTSRQLGNPWGYRRFVNMFVNGNRMGGTTHMMEDAQTPGAEMLNEFWPDDSNGDLFKLQPWFETQAESSTQQIGFVNESWCTLLKFTTPSNGVPVHKLARYRNNYLIRSANTTANDYSSIYALIDAANSAPPSNSILTSTFSSYVNIDEFLRVIAIEHVVGDWDSVGCRNEQNMYGYKPQNGKWSLMKWDMNIILGNGSWDPGQNLFIVSRTGTGNSPGPQSAPLDTVMQGFFDHPPFRRIYLRALKEICNGPWVASTVNAVIDAKQTAIAASGVTGTDPTAIKTFISTARSSILTQIAAEEGPFSINGTNIFTTNKNFVVLTGRAPVEVQDLNLSFNGIIYPVSFTSVANWTVSLVLQTGDNQIAIQGYDRLGNALSYVTTNLTITYDGLPTNPKGSLVINEIMYNPTIPGASYVELYNNSDVAFDLSTWRLDGVDYTFPIGAVMSGRSFLAVVKNIAAMNTALYNGTNPVAIFGQFPGSLNPQGQTISLIKPGATPVDDTVINKVHYEAPAPWPAAANGQGSALQLIDPSQDNSRAGNWSDGTGWRFASLTGNFGTTSNGTGTNVLIFMQAAGEAYIDDVTLVPLSGPSAGLNLLQNSDFEAPVTTTFNTTNWIIPATMSGSGLTNTFAHSGNYSLHVVATNGGSVANAIRQILPPYTTNILFTLSFWYHTVPNSTNINVRTFPGSALAAVVNARPIGTTPSLTNSGLASLPNFPMLWLNEVQSDNVSGPTDHLGQHDPWIELYNSGTTNIPLAGLYLANNYTNLTQWPFPVGASIDPGQFILIWADGQPEQSTPTEWHTSFRLSSSSGSVALSRFDPNNSQHIGGVALVLDYLNYAGLTPGQSYGDYPDAQPFDRQTFYTTATPGTNNYGPPVNVLINEWLASNVTPGGYPDPADNKYDDWFELYNADLAHSANIGGFYLANSLANKFQWRIPFGTVIPPGGFLLVWADSDLTQNGTGTNGDLHASFKLSKNGDAIGLFAVSGTNVLQVDYVSFTGQINNITQGRFPDGGNNIYSFSTMTPRMPNSASGNRPPVLAAISPKTIYAGQSFNFTASGSDPDAGQTLTYSLVPNFPVGATIDPATGLFQWTPPATPSSTVIAIAVTDNGVPNLSDTKTFQAVVADLPAVTLTNLGGGSISLAFPTIAGKNYKVQYADFLGATVATTWHDLGSSFTAGGSTATVGDNMGANTKRFYRLVPLD